MADLLLDDGQWQLVDVDVVHDVAVAEGVDRELVGPPAPGVRAVFPVEARLPGVIPEDLAYSVLRVGLGGPPGRVYPVGQAATEAARRFPQAPLVSLASRLPDSARSGSAATAPATSSNSGSV